MFYHALDIEPLEVSNPCFYTLLLQEIVLDEKRDNTPSNKFQENEIDLPDDANSQELESKFQNYCIAFLKAIVINSSVVLFLAFYFLFLFYFYFHFPLLSSFYLFVYFHF